MSHSNAIQIKVSRMEAARLEAALIIDPRSSVRKGGQQVAAISSTRRVAAVTALVVCLAGALAVPAGAAELKKETAAAFERYVRIREAQLDGHVERSADNGHAFLYVDSLSSKERVAAYRTMNAGQVFIERRKLRDQNGREINCPDGLIHHWLGTVFIPGATLEKTIALVQDYDRHHINYAPEVLISRELSQQGNEFKIHMRFIKKKVVTVVVDTWQEVRYVAVRPNRMYSAAIATRIQEVEHYGQPGETLKPEGKDGGYLWRLNTYWKFEERDGGVYVQCEAISLTRDVPFLITWLRPFITGVPKESLMFSLGTTRKLLLQGASSTTTSN